MLLWSGQQMVVNVYVWAQWRMFFNPLKSLKRQMSHRSLWLKWILISIMNAFFWPFLFQEVLLRWTPQSKFCDYFLLFFVFTLNMCWMGSNKFGIQLYLPFDNHLAFWYSLINSIQLCYPFDIQALGPTESAETASYRVITCTVGRPLSPRDHITLYHYMYYMCIISYRTIYYWISYYFVLHDILYYVISYHSILYFIVCTIYQYIKLCLVL